MGEDAFDYFDEWAGDKVLRLVETRTTKDGRYCELYHEDEQDETKSINYLLVKEGFALLDYNGGKSYDGSWNEAANEGIDKNPDLEEVFEK